MSREQLYPALSSGKVDMVAAMVTVTPEREKLVAFSVPTRTGVNEVVVTGPGAPPINTVDDLAGQEVFVRKGSIYDESLTAVNGQLKSRGKAPAVLKEAPQVLEDDDILEMVNAGLVKITIVDDYLADFWKQVFTDMMVHDTLPLRTGGSLAVAIRKDSPRLGQAINEFISKNSLDSTIGRTDAGELLRALSDASNATSEP
jgi:ABC-type amino acid transport substrate-binding protein